MHVLVTETTLVQIGSYVTAQDSMPTTWSNLAQLLVVEMKQFPRVLTDIANANAAHSIQVS
jgi:hypothetical protein